jgi:hypothetical protein
LIVGDRWEDYAYRGVGWFSCEINVRLAQCRKVNTVDTLIIHALRSVTPEEMDMKVIGGSRPAHDDGVPKIT